MSEHSVVLSKVISAPREELFEAFTNPDVMTKWFYPEEDMSVEVENTFNVGGEYTLKMHGKDGVTYTHFGEYKEIVSPEKLVFTWNSDFVQNTLVTIQFNESGAGTEIVLTHDLLPSQEQVECHTGGWNGCFARLENTMAS